MLLGSRASTGFFIALALASACEPTAPTVSSTKVIYGTDNRKELDDPANAPAMVTAAQSTAVLVHRTDLTGAAGATQETLPTATMKDLEGVCDSEPFAAEPSAGFCSGFLVAPDVFVTAGHCITSQSDCDSVALVFDYAYDAASSIPTDVRSDNVYFCKDIVGRAQVDAGADFSVIHLDRQVAGRAPLALRTDGKIPDQTALTMIGYPIGVPLKIDGGKHVHDNSAAAFFQANTDSYGGNSGSAILNSVTGVVEGVLVRGEDDFVPSPTGCQVSKVCPEDGSGCRGEDATRTTEFAALVPSL